VSGELSLARAVERLVEPDRTRVGPVSDTRSALVVCGLAATEHPGDVVVSTVAADGDVEKSLTTALARLWMSGVPVDWTAYHHGERRLRIPLPTYPFQRQRCWFGPDPDATEASNHRKRIT
jgi:acyl transferase domain-containing protein